MIALILVMIMVLKHLDKHQILIKIPQDNQIFQINLRLKDLVCRIFRF